MQTLIIDIINNKALRLLEDMELLQLIHIRRAEEQIAIDWAAKYKGQ